MIIKHVENQKKEHVKAVKEMNLQKSALCQHILTCDHFIAWDNASILKIEPHYRKRRIAESFLINKRAKVVNVLIEMMDWFFHPYTVCC